VWVEHSRVHEGAEAVVSTGTWMGLPAVLKKRRKRGWRHPSLEESLTRRRIIAEARILTRLDENEIPAPKVLAIDLHSRTLLLSRLKGVPFVELIDNGQSNHQHFVDLGMSIRNIHNAGIAHGDLTTHNIWVSDGNSMIIIDFGLGKVTSDVESFGTDLHGLYESLSARHPEIKYAMDSVIEGYLGETGVATRNNPSSLEVIKRLNVIQERVRYHG